MGVGAMRRGAALLAPGRLAAGASLLVACAGLAIAGYALGVVLSGSPLPLRVTAVAVAGILGVLALALARYDAAAGLGFLLLGAVRVEPAPADLIFAILIAIALVTGRIRLSKLPFGMFLLAGAFLALNLVSTIEAMSAPRAALYMSVTAYLLAFAFWLVAYVDGPRRARLIALMYVVSAVFLAAMSTLALYVSFPFNGEFLQDGYRARGLFKDANVYGPFLVPAALLLLYDVLEPRLFPWRPTIKLLLFSTVVAGIVFAYSRAAWLNLALGVGVLLIVMLMRRGGSRKALAMLLVVLVGVGAATAVIVATDSVSFFEERAQYQQYDTERFGAQRTGFELAMRHPLGIGPGQFEVLNPVSAHSTFVRTIAEQGVLGFSAVFGLLFGTLVIAARSAVLGRDSFGISSAILLAAWCGILANSAFVDTLHWRHLWLLAGLIWVAPVAWRARAQASSGTGARTFT